jgi:hypothetical protein
MSPEYIPGKACLKCSGPLAWRAGRKVREGAKFCSNDCKLAYQRKHPTRERQPRITQSCANPACAKPVSFLATQRGAGRPGRVHSNGKWYDYGERVYCSIPCKHAGQKIVMTGKRYVEAYSNVTTFRTMVRKQFLDRCALCGWDEAACDVAHIVARKSGGTDDFENVVMLCPNHHRMFDCGLIDAARVREARSSCLRHLNS